MGKSDQSLEKIVLAHTEDKENKPLFVALFNPYKILMLGMTQAGEIIKHNARYSVEDNDPIYIRTSEIMTICKLSEEMAEQIENPSARSPKITVPIMGNPFRNPKFKSTTHD
jgi:hypothetical protein